MGTMATARKRGTSVSATGVLRRDGKFTTMFTARDNPEGKSSILLQHCGLKEAGCLDLYHTLRTVSFPTF